MNKEINVFFHEPGVEFWLHFDFFPNGIPTFFLLPADISSMDVAITKEVSKTQEMCREWTSQDQIGESFDEVGRLQFNLIILP